MDAISMADTAALVIRFLDVAIMATGRATYHEDKSELHVAEEVVHRVVFEYDRGVYLAVLALAGTMDRARMVGVERALSNPFTESRYLDLKLETKLLHALSNSISKTRQVKLLAALAADHVNNKRTRNLTDKVVDSWSDVDYMAVKFKSKLRSIFIHRYGQRRSSIIRDILAKPVDERTDREKSILTGMLADYGTTPLAATEYEEMLAFVLNDKVERPLECDMPLTAKYIAAVGGDRQAVQGLPQEVAQGILTSYYPGEDARKVSLQEGQMSQRTKMRQQRSASKVGVKLEFDPTKQSMVELYVYAHERKITKGIQRALESKAKTIAGRMNAVYEKVAIVLDTSISMRGKSDNAWRPIAVSEAIRDVLCAGATDASLFSNHEPIDPYTLTKVGGPTALAHLVLEALKVRPDVLYILTDGYENAPAGRVEEVVGAVRDLEIAIPIYQLTAVMGAKRFGARDLAPKYITTVPVLGPLTLPASMLRMMIVQDTQNALDLIVNMALEG